VRIVRLTHPRSIVAAVTVTAQRRMFYYSRGGLAGIVDRLSGIRRRFFCW